MDRINEWDLIARNVIEDYATAAYKAKSYFVEDEKRQIYTVVTIPDPDYPISVKAGIVVLARIVESMIVIEQDITDRPLYEELVRNGIPREQIILAYAGEAVPE